MTKRTIAIRKRKQTLPCRSHRRPLIEAWEVSCAVASGQADTRLCVTHSCSAQWVMQLPSNLCDFSVGVAQQLAALERGDFWASRLVVYRPRKQRQTVSQ